MQTKLKTEMKAVVLLLGAGIFVTDVAAQTTPAPKPTTCNRACWTARAESCTTLLGSNTRAIIHHTASSGDWSTTSLESSKSRVRSHQNYHMDNNGWCGYGYHFLVDKLGNIFEGRRDSEGSSSAWKRGAHDGCNANSMGFSGLGYMHSPYNNAPTTAMLNSFYAVIAWRMPSGWSPYGSGSYCGTTVGTVGSHRNVKATTCPGDLMFNYVGNTWTGGTMRNAIAALRTSSPPPPPPPPPSPIAASKPALFRNSTAVWYLRNDHLSGGAHSSYSYGASNDKPVMGDWNGDGIKTPGVFRNGQWFLRNSNSGGGTDITFWFGATGDIPVVGDWDFNGVDTVGIFRNGEWFLSDNFSGTTHHTFWWGQTGDIPVAGDWTGDGWDWVGVYRPSTTTFWLKEYSGSHPAFVYGNSTDIPIVGDWDNNGSDTVGVFRGGAWYLRNSNSAGNADVSFLFGDPTDKPLVWK
jgi:hypothetical protein